MCSNSSEWLRSCRRPIFLSFYTCFGVFLHLCTCSSVCLYACMLGGFSFEAFFIEHVRRCSGDVGSILGSVHGRGQNSLRHKHMKMVTNVLALLQKLGMVRSRHEALVVWSQNHEKIIWWLWLPFNRSYGRRVAEIRTPLSPASWAGP